MTISEHIGLLGLIPVIVFDRVSSALPTAQAMLDGGLPLMEITLRTSGGLAAIGAIRERYPEILLGAGTVLSVDQAKDAISAGAQFIVTPGFDDAVVEYCQNRDICIMPGCATPTEITQALNRGIHIVKFFPANVYGGIKGCNALHAPFRSVKFVPTGGIDLSNLSEFVHSPFIHAIGGGWLCSSKDIANNHYHKISETVRNSIKVLLGLELADIEGESILSPHEINESLIKTPQAACHELITIKTNSPTRATYYLSRFGFAIQKGEETNSTVPYLENKNLNLCLLSK